MSRQAFSKLGSLMLDKRATVDPIRYESEIFDLYSIPGFTRGKPDIIAGRDIGSVKQLVAPNDVLLSRIVPHIRRAWTVGSYEGRRQIASGEWIIFRSDRFEPAYLRHVLTGDDFHTKFMQTVAGVGGSLLRARSSQVANITIQLPAISEQRRIAAILDQADALRAKRRAALVQLDELALAIFAQMFGTVKEILNRWEVLPLQELLQLPLRNGTSPSTRGAVKFNVLTLAAITGSTFNSLARKAALFQHEVPLDKTVSLDDFLVCRGNGNINLVGRGFFPDKNMPDTAFPDTMIAVRTSSDRISRLFLETVWNMSFVREQLEQRAQTTNGTYKVNQQAVEETLIILPPINQQRGFERRIAEIRAACRQQAVSASKVDALFASLQHRAFRGEL